MGRAGREYGANGLGLSVACVTPAARANPEHRPRRGRCYTRRIMFITRKHIKGSNDRGAWPWRRPHDFNAEAA